MPAGDHAAAVHYQLIPPTCYALTLSHTGMGEDPIPSPTSSSGCDTGRYLAGTVVSLTAQPAAEWRVDHWTGSDQDSSTSLNNQITIPVADHTTSVHYAEIPPACFLLTLAHSGMGNELAAQPPNSAGCEDGRYQAGSVISLTAQADVGWEIGAWSGTDNDAATTLQNMLTMPDRAHTVMVTYRPICYRLRLQHSGVGNDPIAQPEKSADCGTEGFFVSGAFILLRATPALDMEVGGWSGTADDSSTALNNSVTMPATNHTVSVSYVPAQFVRRFYLPFASTSCHFSQHEEEPNQSAGEAFGALCLDQIFTGNPNDTNDYFYFYLPQPRRVTLAMRGMTGTDPQLQLYRQVVSADNLAVSLGGTPYVTGCNLSQGRYYVRVLIKGNFSTTSTYELELRSAPPSGSIPPEGYDCGSANN
jgi:hypothetical protein